ncbi:hypothetical protein N9Z65_00505 [bacterium]|nr:hypothetical protein [bacterium]
MKKMILTALLAPFFALGNNEIYLDQSGNTGQFNIVQFGAANKIGDTNNRSTLVGEGKNYDLVFVGDENKLDVNNVGSGDIFDLLVTGTGNQIETKIEGNENQFVVNLAGNNNSISVAGSEDFDPALTSNSFINFFVEGNGNDFNFNIYDSNNIFNSWLVLGDQNIINSYQEGQPGGIGHTQYVEVFGANNTFDIVQVGIDAHTIDISVTGNDNNYTILQTDGSAPTYLGDNNILGAQVTHGAGVNGAVHSFDQP